MIEKIKMDIKKNIGSNVRIVVNNVRNKSEEFVGNIKEAYNFVFIIETYNNNIKSFNYSDILTKDIVIFFN